MKFYLVLSLVLSPCLASAKILDPSQINERQTIDSQKATLLIFPDPASFALTINELELTPMGEGSEGTIWKLTPQCQSNCEQKEFDLEFHLASGQHLIWKIKLENGVKDHVLQLAPTPTLGIVKATREKVIPLARETFLRAVRGFPEFPKSDAPIPDSVKSFAKHWNAYQSEQFLIFHGNSVDAKRTEVEALKDPSIVLMGFYDENIVVICRRKP